MPYLVNNGEKKKYDIDIIITMNLAIIDNKMRWNVTYP